ncbi:hypothetical protein PAXRUDRAFT_167663, partial [Paxillus rubicundulus Ve08.2h10]
KDNNFESKLPDDVKVCKTPAATADMRQGTLDEHVWEIEPGEYVLPYMDKLFHVAAVEWLITNQVRSITVSP